MVAEPNQPEATEPIVGAEASVEKPMTAEPDSGSAQGAEPGVGDEPMAPADDCKLNADSDAEIRSVPLPAGWEGLSIKLCGERVVVSEVPKACFSSRSFEKGARPQVDGVSEGDEIVTMNGDPVMRIAERILTADDLLCACTSGEAKHAVGSKTKFDSPPCAACDFGRRRKQLGFDVALQMWLRAVKRNIKIVLGVRTGSADWADEAKRTLASTTPSESSIASRASTVVELKASSESVSTMEKALAKLAALDDVTRKKAKDSKGKGKGKGKDKGKGKRPTGPNLARTRLTPELVTGQVDEWKGKFGWIKPTNAVDHAQGSKHKGRLYVHMQDLEWWVGVKTLKVGQYCRFHVYVDANSLGAEECTVLGEETTTVDWESSASWSWTESSWEVDGAKEGPRRDRSRSRDPHQ